MDAKTMLDKATLIIARQDVTGDNRSLLLFFMNTARRAVLRDNPVRKFFGYNTVAQVNGIIDAAAANLKLARTVEYLDASNKIHRLSRLKDYDTARAAYPDFTLAGPPLSYLEMGTQIWLLPVPASGTVKIYGEFWPADLTDSETSGDILTAELPEAWIYLAAAEYLDYFGEADKAAYWRQKGTVIVQSYLKQDAKGRTFGLGLNSDPFGDGGVT
ncbi:MAG: hypothetical protein P4N59_25670 [Negativicutes bacterium]|nr:hypothetical protein [Negativicutes bacterium]